ncbi:hypothetical protein [Calothrix rhizosoleniae]|uniref:hypothetical protein n=1 Tax=Calothrix rhizosoleniae TaxID=888997 RepID=UPI001F471636|nr:hypothetical protein [Calothrix rhizosoleniae]
MVVPVCFGRFSNISITIILDGKAENAGHLLLNLDNSEYGVLPSNKHFVLLSVGR